MDRKQRALKELLEKFGGSNMSITQETADELAAKGTPAEGLPITTIEDDNNVVLGCAFWHQHAFVDDRRCANAAPRTFAFGRMPRRRNTRSA
jgi:hypothetical protein